MKRMLVVLAAMLVAAPALAVVPFADAPTPTIDVPTIRSPQPFDEAAYERAQQQKFATLVADQVVAGLDDPITVSLTDAELETISSGICTDCARSRALLVGMVKPVGVAVDIVDAKGPATRRTKDGGLVWTRAIQSEQAGGLRVHFTAFWLPPGTELYLYTMQGEVFGPYTGAGPNGTGEFWSHTVSGPTAVLQLRQYGPAARGAGHNTYFEIADIGHVGQRFFAKYNAPAQHPLCSFNAECVENASCYSESAVADAKYAIAHMQYVSRPYIYFCSGGLLNNTSGDQTPYFLTANHCISKKQEAGSLEAYFQFWTDCNSPECPEYNQVSSPRTLGSTILSTNKSSDYTLLQLDEPAPAGSAFLGWTSTEVAYTDGYELYRISHPGGAPQAYSYHTVDPSVGTCSSWPRGDWIYSYDVVGATEGGSSGSPVVNASGQVVGQLSGACGTNLDDTCDNDSNATVDGAFAAYFSEVSGWLDAGGCQDADGDGYTDAACGGNDCDDSDPNVNPGASEDCANGIDDDCDGAADSEDSDCVTCPDADGDGYSDASCGGADCDDADPFVNPGATEVCDNGIDDDCDGATDANDSDCGSCLPLGASCSSDGECCSSKCRGAPGKKICR